ncbi:MAG: flagellar protein FlaG [Chloroflexi bacterium]|nr:flagellar protein FlaG [Chloroflexota bacterium]
MEKSVLPVVGATMATDVATMLRSRAEHPAPQPSPGVRPASDAELIGRAAAAEVASNIRQTFARFTVDHDTHEVSVQIVDSESNEVLRTIPNEDLRRMAQRYRASQGFVLDSAV